MDTINPGKHFPIITEKRRRYRRIEMWRPFCVFHAVISCVCTTTELTIFIIHIHFCIILNERWVSQPELLSSSSTVDICIFIDTRCRCILKCVFFFFAAAREPLNLLEYVLSAWEKKYSTTAYAMTYTRRL